VALLVLGIVAIHQSCQKSFMAVAVPWLWLTTLLRCLIDCAAPPIHPQHLKTLVTPGDAAAASSDMSYTKDFAVYHCTYAIALCEPGSPGDRSVMHSWHRVHTVVGIGDLNAFHKQ
jgi:hypothetical protein